MEVEEAMSTDDNRAVVWFLAGAAIGAAISLLFAPKPGSVTRHDIADAGRGLMDRGHDLYEQGRKVADEAADLFERGKKLAGLGPRQQQQEDPPANPAL
jgi:gas vesicle protein